MKNGSISLKFKGLVIALLTFFSSSAYSQVDTLHLYYHHTQIAPPDSIQAKIEKWAKALTGKHVDIQVVAYYHKPEFKKFSQQRLDELFITLNRKARAVITIESMTTKKGEDYQRTMVDIIYKPTVSPEEAAAAKAKAEADAAKAKEEEKKKKDEEKAKKESDKKSKTDVAAEQTKKDEGKKEKTDKKPESKSAKPAKPAVVNGSPNNKPAKGAYVTQEDVTRVKSARLIVPTTDYPGLDSLLTTAVKSFWTFSKNVEYGTMSYTDAKKLAKTDKNILIFIITNVRSQSLTHSDASGGRYRYVSSGSAVMLEDGKGKTDVSSFFPTFEERTVTDEGVGFAVAEMSSLLSNLEKYSIKNNMTFNKPFRQNAPRLKDKTLFIPEGWLHDKLEVRDIPAIYEGKFKIVDYETWSDAIVSKKDVAYVIVVPFPIGGDFVYLHYLMDAATGDVLFISQPKVAMKVQGFNVSKMNTGYIAEKNIKGYNDAFHMKVNEEETEEKPAEAQPEEKKAEDKKAEEKSEKPKKEDKKKKKD